MFRCLSFFICAIMLCSAAGAQVTASDSIKKIEALVLFIRQNINAGKDSIAMQKIVDSIAEEGNWEKTEYAGFYVLQERFYAGKYTLFDIKNPENLSQLVQRFKSPSIKALCKFYLGESLCDAGQFTQGMEFMLEAVSECKAIGYKKIPRIYVMFYLLGNRYYNFNNYQKCIEYSRLSAEYGNHEQNIGLYNTWGLAYQKLGLYDSANIKFTQIIQQAKQYNVPAWEYIGSGNLGRTYCLQRNFAKSLPLLYIDVVNDSAVESMNAAVSCLYMAEAYCALRKPDSALHFIQLSKTIFTRHFDWDSSYFFSSKICWYYYQVMSEWLKLNHNYADALKYIDTASENEKRFTKSTDWQLLTSTETRIEGLEYQKSIQLLDAEKKNEQLQKIILFIALGSALLITLLILKRQKLKQQKEMQLAKEKEAVLMLQQKQAAQELETAKQQLDDFMKRMEEKNSVMEQMKASLLFIKEDASSEHDTRNINQQLIQLAGATILTQSDWEDFQRRFEKVYPAFFADLKISLPGITPSEERLIALLKLNISYKQMGYMLGISLESVRTAKYRLRKKFTSTGNADLYLL